MFIVGDGDGDGDASDGEGEGSSGSGDVTPGVEPAKEESDLDKEWRDEREGRRTTRRYHALLELVTTEVGYLMDLRALVSVRVPWALVNADG